MSGRVHQNRKLISFVQGRRGKISILDCLLTVLSRGKSEGTWPQCTFDQLTAQASALRLSDVKEPSLRSVVYRAGLFERVPDDADRVRWRLNAKGRQIVENAARGRAQVLI